MQTFWRDLGLGLLFGLTTFGCAEDPLVADDPDEDGASAVDAARDAALPEPVDQGVGGVDAAPAEPDFEPLAGCPIAVAPGGPLKGQPGFVTLLDGEASQPGDAAIRAWQWAVISAPDGSRAAVGEPASPDPSRHPERSDDPATSSAAFVPDLFGEYRLRLTVTDADGRAAPGPGCHQAVAEVVLDVAPVGQGIQIELSWDTPTDDDPLDHEGTDVDLHLLHPDGRAWAQAPLDCYYANAAPHWGPLGPAGDAALDVDDVNGFGPETITLDTPEDTLLYGAPYLVGVHYYRAEAFVNPPLWGPSEARIRIFLDGVLVFDERQVLAETNDWWIVAEIHWPARQVVRRGELSAGQPADRDAPGRPSDCAGLCRLLAGCGSVEPAACDAACAIDPEGAAGCLRALDDHGGRYCRTYAACLPGFEPDARSRCADVCEFGRACGGDAVPAECVADCIEAEVDAVGDTCLEVHDCATAYVCDGLAGPAEPLCVAACAPPPECPRLVVDPPRCVVDCTAGIDLGWLAGEDLEACLAAAGCDPDARARCLPQPAAPPACVDACAEVLACARTPFDGSSDCLTRCANAVIADGGSPVEVLGCLADAECDPQRTYDCLPEACATTWGRVEACHGGLVERAEFLARCHEPTPDDVHWLRCVRTAVAGPSCFEDLFNCQFL